MNDKSGPLQELPNMESGAEFVPAWIGERGQIVTRDSSGGTSGWSDKEAWRLARELQRLLLTRAGGGKPPLLVAFKHEPAAPILAEIIAQREHQIAAGYTPEHDDAHQLGEIALGAAYYAAQHVPLYYRAAPSDQSTYDATLANVLRHVIWPWPDTPPSDNGPRRSLISAAAMIIAEIERLDRRGEAASEEFRKSQAAVIARDVEGAWGEDGRLTLEPAYYEDIGRVYMALLLVANAVTSPQEIATWSPEQRKAAAEWAISVHFSASDHEDIVVPPRPDFIRRR